MVTRISRIVATVVLVLAVGCGRDSPATTPSGPNTHGSVTRRSHHPRGSRVRSRRDVDLRRDARGRRVRFTGISPQAARAGTVFRRRHQPRGGRECHGIRTGSRHGDGAVGVRVHRDQLHARGWLAMGAPGTTLNPGASQANVLRRPCRGPDSEPDGICGHEPRGGSRSQHGRIGSPPRSSPPTRVIFERHPTPRGAFGRTRSPVPLPAKVRPGSIRTPYQLHHGDADDVVPIESDRRLANLLQTGGVVHELHVYPGAEHNAVSTNSAVLARIRPGCYRR